MPRRRTTIGKGAFGRPVPSDLHAWEVLQRILTRGHPLTEDAIFLAMQYILHRKGSHLLQKVRASKNVGVGNRAGLVGDYRYFQFSPDIDLLEVRPGGAVIGYELKGYRRAGREIKAPIYYEGLDQALAYLMNPVSSPFAESFVGSIFDNVYLVHPAGSNVEKLADLIQRCTPLGLGVVDQNGVKELVKPKPNPYLSPELKAYFLDRLDAFQIYTQYKINPIQ